MSEATLVARAARVASAARAAAAARAVAAAETRGATAGRRAPRNVASKPPEAHKEAVAKRYREAGARGVAREAEAEGNRRQTKKMRGPENLAMEDDAYM